MQLRRFFLFFAVLLSVSVLVFPGCGSESAANDPYDGPFNNKDGGASSGSSGSSGANACLLNNCFRDEHCEGCSGSRSKCNLKEKRCVACGPDAGGKTCKGDESCTPFGDCVPKGLTCALDSSGVPTISCKANADCAACDPAHKVCDGGKCVGCRDGDLTNCQSTEVCKAGACIAACPAACTTDAQCDSCNKGGLRPATACNRGVCSQCSKTRACPNGESCDVERGVCKKLCGLPDRVAGTCTKDEECAGCTGTTKCKLPINGGAGKCIAPAAGCEDLIKGVFVLPDPFSRFTQACSSDANCAGVSADYNLGKTLRDITGLGFIKDGNLSYPMQACASVELLDKSCGLCVPCKQDQDCTPIDITKAAGDIFGPLGAIATDIALDKVFGPNDKKVHMYCEKLAGDYGACLPCSNVLARCGQVAQAPGQGTCTHDVCAEGEKLGVQCDECTAAVCAQDPYCCVASWDFACKQKVDQFCKTKTCYPLSCLYKSPGWYCDETTGKERETYRCANGTIAEGFQCEAGKTCRRKEQGDIRSGAVTGANGKPACQ